VDVALTLVEFFDDLFHSNAVASTKEIQYVSSVAAYALAEKNPATRQIRVAFMGRILSFAESLRLGLEENEKVG